MGETQSVWPGQDWRLPDGRIWRVGAVMSSGGERTALLTLADDQYTVAHWPAADVARMGTFVRSIVP